MSRFRSRSARNLARRTAPLLLAGALALAAVACGDEGPSGGDCSGDDDGGGCGEAGGRGTAVEHMYGTTEVPEDPGRAHPDW
jgi:hypothetical protein